MHMSEKTDKSYLASYRHNRSSNSRQSPSKAHELQIMDQGKQIQAQLYNRNIRVLPRLEQSQKVVVQLNPDKNNSTPV